jgi:signal peptidase I
MAMTQSAHLRSRPVSSLWVAVLAAIAVSYLGVYILAPRLPAGFGFAILQPLLFLLPAGVALWLTRQDWRTAVVADRGLLLIAAALGLGQISLMIIAGVWFGGFGKSSYSHSLTMMPINLWYIAAMLVGREVSRWFLVRALRGRGETFALLTVWSLFFITGLSPYSVTQLGQPDSLFKFLGLIVLPAAGRELLATRLALAGGPGMAMSYVGLLTLFEWLSPILPTPNWLVVACLGVLVPVAGFAVIDSLQTGGGVGEETTIAEAASEKESQGISPLWLVTAVTGLLIFWFNTGIFGVFPMLVHGISMEPRMHTGDVAIVRRVPASDLRVGDVIQFQLHGRYVIHRIIHIEMKEGRRIITAQGDNVAMPDEPVDERAVKGRMLFFIPKVGWPLVAAKTFVESR